MNKILRLNDLRTRAAMNAKISVFVICIEVIIYLLLYNLLDCTFKRTHVLFGYENITCFGLLEEVFGISLAQVKLMLLHLF